MFCFDALSQAAEKQWHHSGNKENYLLRKAYSTFVKEDLIAQP